MEESDSQWSGRCSLEKCAGVSGDRTEGARHCSSDLEDVNELWFDARFGGYCDGWHMQPYWKCGVMT